MVLRFKIGSPIADIADNYIICGLPNDVTDLGNSNIEAIIKIDNTTILNTLNLSSIPIGLITVPLPNGVAVLVKTTTLFGYSYALIINENNLGEVPSYTERNFYFKFSGSNLRPFEKSFTCYDYDIGNNQDEVPPVQDNIELDFHLIADNNASFVNGVQTLPYSKFIAFRKPFTNQVRIYNLSSTQGNITYTDDANNLLLASPDGFICADNDLVIKQRVEINGNICETTANLPLYKDICSLNVGISCNISTTINDVITNSVAGVTTVETQIDFDKLHIYNRLNRKAYANDCFTLSYQLFNINGTLVDSKEYYINTKIDFPFIYNPANYRFTCTLPFKGDYIVIIKLEQNGLLGSQYTNTQLQDGKWYIINKTSNAADFTLAGAADNFEGTIFNYNGGSINWDIASVIELLPIIITTRNEAIRGSNFVELNPVSCNVFKLENLTFDYINYTVYSLNNKKEWEVIGVEDSQLLSLSYAILSFSEDNIYKIKVTRLGVDSYFILLNYCNLINCLTELVTNILCPTKEESCSNICEKVYEFNSLVINAHAYFSLLNTEYNFNYIYEIIDADKLEEIFNLKQFLDKFKEYCKSRKCGSCSNCTGK
jgi:hypothetical protein